MANDTENIDSSDIYSESGKSIICELIKNNNLSVFEDFVEKNNVQLYKYSSNVFDILIYAIKNDVSIEMIKFIIEKTPYENFNYTIKESDNFISAPLFVSLARNNFSVADLLIEKGADINETLQCHFETIKEENLHSHQNLFKYFDVNVNRDCFTLDYSSVIYSNIIQYLCETDTLNLENLEYIKSHGFEISSIRPGLIKQLERNNKQNYAKLIANSINNDLD